MRNWKGKVLVIPSRILLMGDNCQCVDTWGAEINQKQETQEVHVYTPVFKRQNVMIMSVNVILNTFYFIMSCSSLTFSPTPFACIPAVQAQITNVTGKTVIEGGNVTLKCLAKGNPTPTIMWTRLSDHSVVTMPLTNIRRQNASVGYRCTADNGVKSRATRDVFLDVRCECYN